MTHSTYTCNICRCRISESLNGDIDGLTLRLDGPATSPGELLAVERQPDHGSVHICGSCSIGLHRAMKDVEMVQFLMVKR